MSPQTRCLHTWRTTLTVRCHSAVQNTSSGLGNKLPVSAESNAAATVVCSEMIAQGVPAMTHVDHPVEHKVRTGWTERNWPRTTSIFWLKTLSKSQKSPKTSADEEIQGSSKSVDQCKSGRGFNGYSRFCVFCGCVAFLKVKSYFQILLALSAFHTKLER